MIRFPVRRTVCRVGVALLTGNWPQNLKVLSSLPGLMRKKASPPSAEALG